MFDRRSKSLDYSRLETLFCIGGYQRRLPVSIARMIENAYDWEHLPYIHESSFNAISLLDEGDWGWRAIVTLPDSSSQHLELLVDKSRNYWATTVLSGDAKGFEIHTRASQVSSREIDVSIKFYLPKRFSKVLIGLQLSKALMPFFLYEKIAQKLGVQRVSKIDKPQQSILSSLHHQYSVLYDEDEALMSGRQAAIDSLKRRKFEPPIESLSLGSIDHVINELPKVVQFGKHRYVLNRWQDKWLVYNAVCPHRLGPLEASEIDHQGRVTCPWHGYQFDVETGKSCGKGIADLPNAPLVSIVENEIFLEAR